MSRGVADFNPSLSLSLETIYFFLINIKYDTSIPLGGCFGHVLGYF
jgi:hypothetical protein